MTPNTTLFDGALRALAEEFKDRADDAGKLARAVLVDLDAVTPDDERALEVTPVDVGSDRYILLLADAEARARGENLDGSPRRESRPDGAGETEGR